MGTKIKKNQGDIKINPFIIFCQYFHLIPFGKVFEDIFAD